MSSDPWWERGITLAVAHYGRSTSAAGQRSKPEQGLNQDPASRGQRCHSDGPRCCGRKG